MKFYKYLDIINVNNITISIFVIILRIDENVPGRIENDMFLIRAG